MLEKLLYKIVDFGRRHPKLKYVMLLPLAIVYLLDSILYYLGMPFRLISQAVYDHRHKYTEDIDEGYIKHKASHKFRNAVIVLVLLVLSCTYPAIRYIRDLSQPLMITAFDEIENAEMVINQGASIEELKLPEEISARGYALDKNGEPKGNEKQIILKVNSWNAEPGYDENKTPGSVYTFTPNLNQQIQNAAELPSVKRIIAKEEAEDKRMIEIYLNGQGNDLNDGSSPMQAVHSFERAVQLLGDKEGFIWVMNGITIKDEQTWDAESMITLKRFIGTASIPPYTGAIIDIRSSGSLTLGNIVIDGGGVESNAPAIIADGYLELSGKTQIINNIYPDHAGAVDVGSTGKMAMSVNTIIEQCSTDVKGSSIASAKGSSLIEYSE